MDHPSLAIMGYSQAGMLLQTKVAPEIVGIISIHGAREYGVEGTVAHRLDLTFDDVEVPIPDDVLSLQRAMSRRRWAEQNGLVERAPTRADAEAIIAFAKKLHESRGLVLCHCGGGMSRAPAAALICLAVWRGPDAEAECVHHVLSLRPGAVPHIGLVRFADELLDRRGKLVGAMLLK